MKKSILPRREFLIGAVAAAGLALGASAKARRKPNVIVIYTDDQGSCDLPSYGATDLVMPNVEALAARGVRFTQFYAPAPVCSPSRAGLLTGRYPLRAGMPSNAPSNASQPGMPGTQVTMAEMFRAAGYTTGHVGKWHLGFSKDTMPNAQGFDYSFGHMGGCIDNYSHFMYWSGPNHHDLYRNGEAVHADGQYFEDLMVEEASAFIDKNREKPFFLYFAINAPHYPYQGDAKWLKYYADKGVPYPRDLYAAFLTTMDEHIGKLVGKVDELGLREDTIIVFQSDQGHSTEERAHFGGGYTGPYRGAKFSLFEGGIRVPAIVSWPGHIAEGETRDQIGHGCDWMPTLAEWCGVPLLNKNIDGKSLTKVVRSKRTKTPHEVLIWHVQQGQKAPWAVRKGDWKLLGNPEDTSKKGPIGEKDKLFLVNLGIDIGETTNVVEKHPEKVAEMKALYDSWLATQANR
jgi:arylsulfatase A